MDRWGKAMYVTPGIVVDGKLLTTNLVDINVGMRILLGSSYYDDWVNEEPFVTHDPLGNPIDMRHPWNQTTLPVPQKRDFDDKYSWVMSPAGSTRTRGSTWRSTPAAARSRGCTRRRWRTWSTPRT